MRKKEYSSTLVNSDPISRKKKPFIIKKDNKIPIVSNLFNTSNDSIINNSNNDIIDDEDEEEDDDINEENIFEKSIGDQHLLTPINETHRMFSSKNRFGKTYINSLPLKRILVPRSKSPNIRIRGNIKNRNAFKNAYDNLPKTSTRKNEIFSSNSDFLHCRNCMLIVALNRYGKYYFNK